MWTVRATARLRRPDGTLGDVVRSAAAVIKVIPPSNTEPFTQVPVLRFYEDAWSEFAVAPPTVLANGAVLPGVLPQ